MSNRKYRKPYAVSTDEIIRRMLTLENPVTRAVYRQILGSRIDRQETFRLDAQSRFLTD